ncbi:MAG: cyclic nucleotide-binding domain-containing protein [Oleispira antarctica]|uniref:Cyclic nucleotide-binding protein n=1 Tax=Oleispira antarctica RB-8 TaxID=698738 RepID=R4YJS9_OLEAN|nr:cyclic nucleotide-binding domain-containing protein [Oleispira antarctica]MBQ0793718.1 cyclic nucleotide-binding domain-containing protein [Oleispira antarctica]CCK74375.1 Cyclic nucleotide-binding protein [Oleispira antarctica RB-8]
MYLPGKLHEAMDPIYARMQQLLKGLLEGFPLDQDPVPIENVDDLYQHFDNHQLFLITDGMMHFTHEGQTLISFDEGDLVGFSRAFDLPCPTIRADEFVEIQLIDRDEFLRHIYSDKRRQHYWSHFLMCQNSLLINQLAQVSKEHKQTTAGFQNCKPGDIIIKEGDEAEHVYTIISGEADVFSDGIKVGEVGEDEVFGAMAVFTGEKRSATVVARTACTIMAVPQNDFVNLIEAQPKAAVNLIENLARRITAMNQQIIEQQK